MRRGPPIDPLRGGSIVSASATPLGQTKKPRREYRNPPIHEVILDVQFHQTLDEKTLGQVKEGLSRRYSEPPEQINLVQLEMSIGAAQYQNMMRQFGGWQFKREGGWVLQTGLSALSMHLVRAGPWPVGPYAGWSRIFPEYEQLHGYLRDVYGPLQPKRAGLRYLNRIAIPDGADLNEWMAFKLQAPQVLHDLYTFQVRHTWARAGDNDDMSATVGLAKIEVGDAEIAAGNYGVLLDIDVFNLWINKAPSYDKLPEWFDRAHNVENEIFEGCMTNQLRARFDT